MNYQNAKKHLICFLKLFIIKVCSNWNDLNSFITLSRSKKLINAAKKLKIESTTIARRISRLENNLKTQLFSQVTQRLH